VLAALQGVSEEAEVAAAFDAFDALDAGFTAQALCKESSWMAAKHVTFASSLPACNNWNPLACAEQGDLPSAEWQFARQSCMGSHLRRATEKQKVAYDGIVVQICSYVLASNGDIEQTQDQQSDEVMTDHVNLAICKKASSC